MNIEQSLKTLSSHHDRPPPRLNRNFSMDSPSGEVVHALSFSPLIEGIGNEVLLVLPLLAVILPSLCYLLYRQSALPALPADDRDPTPDQLREQFLAGWRGRGNCDVL